MDYLEDTANGNFWNNPTNMQSKVSDDQERANCRPTYQNNYYMLASVLASTPARVAYAPINSNT
uniref:Uncharacterized protein n=1 Tax=Candidatus Kentrum sp. LFY TaxID=2126342 RepID=A0A450W7N6_9GAMM|nr:MAG: hypothetical protein BECKLFY1418C_GA0070996_100253 [Candidatus Kentron sp. LFY]